MYGSEGVMGTMYGSGGVMGTMYGSGGVMGDNIWEWWSDGEQCMGVKESLHNVYDYGDNMYVHSTEHIF